MSQVPKVEARTEVRDGMKITWHQGIEVDDGTVLVDGNRIGQAVAIDGEWAVVGGEGQGNREEVYIYHDTGQQMDQR